MRRVINVTEKGAAAECDGVGKESSARRLLRPICSCLRRTLIECINVFIGHDFMFRALGWINRRIPLIKGIFLVYPASKEYAFEYVFQQRLLKVKWDPWPCGLLLQNGRIVVMFCISATNEDFLNPVNTDNLRKVVKRMDGLGQLFCVERKTYAGILPGVLYAKRIVSRAPEADLTAAIVVQAIGTVRERRGMVKDVPVVVLGGRGFIGRRVVSLVGSDNVRSVDLADATGAGGWPSQLQGEPVIVVNITKKEVLREYVEMIWPGTAVLNEVYPEPTAEIVNALYEKQCDCYHVAGVKAYAIPPFPGAYRGAIPCCAAWPSPKLEVVIKKMKARE